MGNFKQVYVGETEDHKWAKEYNFDLTFVPEQIPRYPQHFKIKKAGSPPIHYSEFMINEIRKCRADINYFLSTWVKIRSLDKGLILFQPHDFQKEFIKKIHNNRKFIGMAGRQSGKSQCTMGYVLWCTLFKNNFAIGIAAHKREFAKELYSKFKQMYETVPTWMQHGAKKWTQHDIELENGNSVKTSSGATTGFRGMSFNMLILDEFAFVEKPDEFYAAMSPTTEQSETAKIVITSTPNGFNMFWDLYQRAGWDAPGENDYIKHLSTWQDVPLYAKKGEEFRKKKIAEIGEDKFEQEYNCVFEDAPITIRDKWGQFRKVTINEFYQLLSLDNKRRIGLFV